MRTISQVVEDVILRTPFLAETIAEDVANNAKIARRIRSEVEKRLLAKVSESAIAMALHRLSKQLKKRHFGLKLLSRMKDLTVRSGLVQLVCANSSDAAEALEVLSQSARRLKGSFFNYSRGLHETVLIMSQELEPEAKKLLGKHGGVSRTAGLSAITMHMPTESLGVPGVYYPVLKVIAHEGISIVEVMSVKTELTVIFEDKDIARAFSAIKKVTS